MWRRVSDIGIALQAPHLLLHYASWVEFQLCELKAADPRPPGLPSSRALVPLFRNRPVFVRINKTIVRDAQLFGCLVEVYLGGEKRRVMEVTSRADFEFAEGGNYDISRSVHGRALGHFEKCQMLEDALEKEIFGPLKEHFKRVKREDLLRGYSVWLRCTYPGGWVFCVCDSKKKAQKHVFCTKDYVRKVAVFDNSLRRGLQPLFPTLTCGWKAKGPCQGGVERQRKLRLPEGAAKAVCLPVPSEDETHKDWYLDMLTRVKPGAASKFRAGWTVDSVCTNGDYVCLKWDAKNMPASCVIPGMKGLEGWKYKGLDGVGSKSMEEWIETKRGACYVGRCDESVSKGVFLAAPSSLGEGPPKGSRRVVRRSKKRGDGDEGDEDEDEDGDEDGTASHKPMLKKRGQIVEGDGKEGVAKSKKPKVGSKVMATWDPNDPEYYPATIMHIHRSGNVDLDFEDTSFWDDAPASVLQVIK